MKRSSFVTQNIGQWRTLYKRSIALQMRAKSEPKSEKWNRHVYFRTKFGGNDAQKWRKCRYSLSLPRSLLDTSTNS